MKNSTSPFSVIAIGLIALMSPIPSSGQSGTNDYVLSSQAEVNAFDPSLLPGRGLVISGPDITTIVPLSSITEVGRLIIENNPLLESLSPLNNLGSVNGELRIANNAAIKDLDGFANLVFTKQINIKSNDELLSINGFQSLIKIEDDFPNLGSLVIANNKNLLAIEGFSAMPSALAIKVSENQRLTHINGFDSLASVRGRGRRFPGTLTIHDNDALVGMDGFSRVQFVEQIGITQNSMLKDLRGLASVTGSSDLGMTISDNESLAELRAFATFYIESDPFTDFQLTVKNNPLLHDPCELSAIVSAMVPMYTAYERIHIEGNGFELSDVLECENVEVVIPPTPLIWLGFDEESGDPISTGSSPAFFSRSPNIPVRSFTHVKGAYAIDFGATPGNYYVESTSRINDLKKMDAFTVSGWINNRSAIMGSGGNRIVSWINNGGNGVDLVYQSDGSLRLGVDGWPDYSPAVSSPGKIPTSMSEPGTWIFFAVTYRSDGQVQFYFGTTEAETRLDVTTKYPHAGKTGRRIGKLAIGAFNDATRRPDTYDRMFRGLIDDIEIFGSALTHDEILAVQHRGPYQDHTPPTAPGNLHVEAHTPNSVTLEWGSSMDNIGVAGYMITDNGTFLINVAPSVTSYTVGLQPEAGKVHIFEVTAFDQANNQQSSAIEYREPEVVPPLIRLRFNESDGKIVSDGSAAATFVKSNGYPKHMNNVPVHVGGAYALDFGSRPGNYFVESAKPVEELKDLSSFTLTGWVNNRSRDTGSGGNRIISWINNGYDGVDLVYQRDGSLRLGINGWPDRSPAFSSSKKVPTHPMAPNDNWTFFAVTYKVIGHDSAVVQYYFGSNTVDACFDVSRLYIGPGMTGHVIGKLAIGAFNDATRGPNTYDRMFKGLIDDVQIHGCVLTPEKIVAVQREMNLVSDRLQLSTISDSSKDNGSAKNYLQQNVPNPFSSTTEIGVSLPDNARVARLVVTDVSGKPLRNVEIRERGVASVHLQLGDLKPGVYFYSLVVDGKVVELKRMAVVR